MQTDPRYAVLFEPVKIGPVTTPNRFYQVPHCTGMGHLRPAAEAAVRGMKAQGGWGVVSTQETEIHPTSDLTPFAEGRIWDDRDIPALARMVDAVHGHGSLAAIQLAHNGSHALNTQTRARTLAPTDISTDLVQPRQATMMDKADIREFRRWHRDAAVRAKQAGFDIVYAYAGHSMSLLQHFLMADHNERSDEYGGPIENRVRLLREVIEDTKEAIGDTCGIAVRLAVDELRGPDGIRAHEEGRAIVELLAELPDLWDVNISGWSNDSATTRFRPEDGYQNDYIAFVKQVTTKPVVAVGRLTSPDLMVSMISKGIVDLIGAARPSIADPFLPTKIRENRIEDIRECIGCNVCVSADNVVASIRCTQNPTMGEEWRRGWHPEVIRPREAQDSALVIGAGPAGLECALQLGRRGYVVTLAEASGTLGGRVRGESGLPGLGAWARVADNRIYELNRMANVAIYKDSAMDADAVTELGIPNVFVATGARWRLDGKGRSNRHAIDFRQTILSPEAIMTGDTGPDAPVLVYDDDQIYLAAVLAEALARAGREVTFATPAAMVSPWTDHTLEQTRVQGRLLDLGVHLMTGHRLAGSTNTGVDLTCTFTDRTRHVPCSTIVPVTERTRETDLHQALSQTAALNHLALIGDAQTPGLIADAIWTAHAAARTFDAAGADADAEFFRREVTELAG